jgi:site-specific DNA recombinase
MSKSSRRKNQKQTNIAVGYTRVSTTEQAVGGISLASQCDSIRRYAEAHGLTLALDPGTSGLAASIYPDGGVFVDGGISGGTDLIHRPCGAKLAVLIQSGAISHVITTTLDRFSRSNRDITNWAYEFQEKGVSLHLIEEGGLLKSSPADKLMLSLRSGLAQWQRENIGLSTKSKLDFKRRNGEKLGGPVPYGYLFWTNKEGVKCLKIDPNEQAIIQRARELRASGLSYRKIGAKLFEENHRPRHQGPWSHEAIRRITEEKEG